MVVDEIEVKQKHRYSSWILINIRCRDSVICSFFLLDQYYSWHEKREDFALLGYYDGSGS
jgi:hypothetical protein